MLKPKSPISESPWTWAALFLVGAFIALGLTQHKFRVRQAQLERQFFARQQSGHTVPVEPPTYNVSSSQLIVTLEPLYWLLTTLVVVASCGFWWSRWGTRRATAPPETRQ